MKKVVITGASGFIGRHLMRILLKNEVTVYAIVRKSPLLPEFSREDLEKVHWIIGDLCEQPENIIQQIKDSGGSEADCFYHFAWLGVEAREKNDFVLQMKNVDISLNALKICEAISCHRFINMGTVGEYVSLNGLISGASAPSPGDIYGAAKVAAREFLTVRAGQCGVGIINTILCSTFGEFRSDDNIISYTIKSLLKGEKMQFGHLEQMWDFLYVEDVAYALYLIGEKGKTEHTYGIGSGVYRQLREYVFIIRDMINPDAKLEIGKLKKRYEKVKNSCVDTFLLQKHTGFKAQYSFEEGIEKTITYFKGDKHVFN